MRRESVAAVVLSLFTPAVLAGPLARPAGPVDESYKTLQQVEPRTPINAQTTPGDADSVYRITGPGSYYLTENLQGEALKNGIEIAASGVTIDLNGFTMLGDVPGSRTFDAIIGEGAISDITVRNGHIRSWSGDAVNIRADNSGRGALAEAVVADENAGNGFVLLKGAVIHHCVATRNGADGFVLADAVATDCVANENGLNGFYCEGAVSVLTCTASSNGVDGIRSIDPSDSDLSSLIADCNASNNDEDGIHVSIFCYVRNNFCMNNGEGEGMNGAGIRATSSRNVIEGNVCISSDWGYRITGFRNVVVGNYSSQSTDNWFIGQGNFYGPIVHLTGLPPAVDGESAPGSITATNPFSNFSY